MGLRGRKPVGIELLTIWEFGFYKAFRLLRDGIPLPSKSSYPIGLTKQELRSFIGELKQMSPEHYWLTTQRLAVEMGVPVNLGRPPKGTDRWWAERQKEDEIRSLRMELNPPGIEALDKRRKIWSDLVEADRCAALRKACGRWAQLSDVWKSGNTSFPRHVVQNAVAFISMKQNPRFPRSTYGDDARVEYLARGMAGVMSGVSPMTGIERLRNMKHDRSGPLWITREDKHTLPDTEQYCGCWRCKVENSIKVTQFSRSGYENGLKVFMELAATTKVPIEWRAKRS